MDAGLTDAQWSLLMCADSWPVEVTDSNQADAARLEDEGLAALDAFVNVTERGRTANLRRGWKF